MLLWNLLATTFINPQTLSPCQLLPSEFHDPFLFCSDVFTLINLKLACCDHFILLFFLIYMKLYSSCFPIFGPFICFRHLYLRLSPSLFLNSVSSYFLKSLPVHLTHCLYIDVLAVDPCIFVAYYYSSAFPIEHVTMFLFEVWCLEWPNTLWMHQLWVNC